MSHRNPLLNWPPDSTTKERQAFSKWMRKNKARSGCWGLWKAASDSRVERSAQRLAKARNRAGRPKHAYPKGTPELWKRRYRDFLCRQGRCTFAAWLKYHQGGEHPLKLLG